MGRFRHEQAPEISVRITDLVRTLEFEHIDSERVHCRRSHGSTADAYARIWELPSVWQAALAIQPQAGLPSVSSRESPARVWEA